VRHLISRGPEVDRARVGAPADRRVRLSTTARARVGAPADRRVRLSTTARNCHTVHPKSIYSAPTVERGTSEYALRGSYKLQWYTIVLRGVARSLWKPRRAGSGGAGTRTLSHPHACLTRCPVLVRRVIAEHRGPHSVCGEYSAYRGCKSLVTLSTGPPVPRRPAAAGVCASAPSPRPPSIYFISDRTLTLVCLSPAPRRRALEVMWSHRQ
jgi:hypothetical protein